MQPQSTHTHKFAQDKLVKIFTVQVELCMSVSRVGPPLLAPRVGLCVAGPGWWGRPFPALSLGGLVGMGRLPWGFGPPLATRHVRLACFMAHPSAPCFALFRPAGQPAPLRFSGDRPCGARPVATHVTAQSLPPHPCPDPTPPTPGPTVALPWCGFLLCRLASILFHFFGFGQPSTLSCPPSIRLSFVAHAEWPAAGQVGTSL